MRFDVKRRLQPSQGLSLVELLIYLAILGMLSLGVGWSVQRFQTKHIEAINDAQFGQESELINAKLRVLLTGGSIAQKVAPIDPDDPNYCYQFSENKPVTFDSTDISSGAIFQYRVSASTTPTLQNAEPKLASMATLGLGASTAVASVRRSLSMWVRLPNVDGNNRVLFDYSPDSATTSYKMVVRVANGNTVRVDMGMGLAEFVYDVSAIRNGEWHHLVVTAGDLSMTGSSPALYVDGSRVSVTASSTAPPPNYVNNLNYKINIGRSSDSVAASWSIGPIGFWNKVLSQTEIGKLGRLESVNVDSAFWLGSPLAAQSTASASIAKGTTVNARLKKGYLFFKFDSSLSDPATGKKFFKIYSSPHASSCPDLTVNDDPVMQGFEQVTTSTCESSGSNEPLLIGSAAAGQSLGFQWKCNLSNGKQQAAATVVIGNATTSIIKSEKACSFPIEASDFDISKTSFFNRGYDSASTAYVIVDDFDPLVDLIAFQGTEFPAVDTGMTATTNVSGQAMAGAPAGTTATWFSNANNNVGMIRVQTSPVSNHDTEWWVTNVFKKIKYKTRSEVYVSERKIVFTLGDAWPIKTCPGLGYKSAYHFYRLQTVSAMTTQQAYRDAFQRTYMGMAGYLGNLRCTNEKDQVSLRVLAVGNNVATIGAWATRQGSSDGTSTPNFNVASQPTPLVFRETRTNLNAGTVGSPPTFSYTNETWSLINPANMYNVPGDNTPRNTAQTTNVGDIQWRWIGGPTVDHNVIMLTDSSLCGSATSVSESSKKGCQGVNTVSVGHSCGGAGVHADSPACRIQQQSGGDRQFGWWHPAEPNESGAYIWMGYDAGGADDNYWDDAGVNTTKPTYLLEYGDHPFDAIANPAGVARSSYQDALATSGDSRTNLDPPNMATKKVKSVNFQYCK